MSVAREKLSVGKITADVQIDIFKEPLYSMISWHV